MLPQPVIAAPTPMAPPPAPLAERVFVRFGATLLANVLRSGMSFLTGLIVARQLGAAGYGDLSFLLGSFAAIAMLLDMGSASGFYTFVARSARSGRFFAVYGGYLALQLLLMIAVIAVILPGNAFDAIWVGHGRQAVLLACAASFVMTQAWGAVAAVGESARRTVAVQIASSLQVLAHFGLILIAGTAGWLTVEAVLLLLIAEHVVLSVVVAPSFIRSRLSGDQTTTSTGDIVRQFIPYCAPLAVYSWVGFGYAFADRWLLQQFGGSTEQAYFSVGQQFSVISLLAATSILRVFWKEIAEARERGDMQRVEQLYSLTCRALYLTGAWISCLLIPYSREILAITLGAEFEQGWLTLGLMFLYAIHQPLGQIAGTFYFASGQTKLYARIGIVMMLVSIPVTYFALASPSSMVPGLALGAVGVAGKLVLLQLVGVYLQHFFIARTHGWKMNVAYQGLLVAVLLTLAVGGRLVVIAAASSLGIALAPLAAIISGSLVYMILSFALLAMWPGMAGLDRPLIRATYGRVRDLVGHVR